MTAVINYFQAQHLKSSMRQLFKGMIRNWKVFVAQFSLLTKQKTNNFVKTLKLSPRDIQLQYLSS